MTQLVKAVIHLNVRLDLVGYFDYVIKVGFKTRTPHVFSLRLNGSISYRSSTIYSNVAEHIIKEVYICVVVTMYSTVKRRIKRNHFKGQHGMKWTYKTQETKPAEQEIA